MSKKTDQARRNLGQFIKDRRKSCGLSQVKLAEAVGIRPATLIDIEKGKPSELNTIISIIRELSGILSVQWLTEGANKDA